MMLRIAAAIGIASLVTVIGSSLRTFSRSTQFVVAALCSQATVFDWPGGKGRLANRVFDFPLLEALPRSAYNAHGAMILAPTYSQQPSSYKLRIPL
jgi:hypothetical protein